MGGRITWLLWGQRGLAKATFPHTPWALGSKVAGTLVGKFVQQAKTFLGNGKWIEVVQLKGDAQDRVGAPYGRGIGRR